MSTTTETGSIRITGIDLTGYMTKDYARSSAFYEGILGLKPSKVFPGGAGAEYELGDGTTFGVWNPGDSMPFQTNNGVLFAVEDLDAAKAALEAHDVPIVMEHESEICFMAMVMDPDGNAVILHKRKPGND
jgi:predicted enzyme related to lactoylglutathione lyase